MSTIASLNCSAQGDAWFAGVGDLAGGVDQSHVSCISPDGRFVGGSSQVAPDGDGFSAILWSPDRGLEDIGSPPTGQGYPSAAFFSLSSGGNAGAGYAITSLDPSTTEAVVWTPVGGFNVLGELISGGATYALSVAGDGRTVAGYAFVDPVDFHAWRWTPGLGMQDLGLLPDTTSGYVWSMNTDGTCLVGGVHGPSRSEAFVWTEAGGMVGLGDLPGGSFFSAATDVTPDGRVVVGFGTIEGQLARGVAWIEGGPAVDLGAPPAGHVHVYALSVAGDGTTAVGYSATEDYATYRAALRTERNGWRHLRDVLESDLGLGSQLAGWTLGSCDEISDDGRTLCGWGTNPDGDEEGWVAYLGTRCPGDFNGDDVVNTIDVLDFLNAWSAGCP